MGKTVPKDSGVEMGRVCRSVPPVETWRDIFRLLLLIPPALFVGVVYCLTGLMFHWVPNSFYEKVEKDWLGNIPDTYRYLPYLPDVEVTDEELELEEE